MLYTLNILQFYLPILSQKILLLCLLVPIHDMWFIYVDVYIGKKKNFAVSTEKGKMEIFSIA